MLAAVAAFAEDFNSPSWRGNPGTSWVQYEFTQDLTEGGTIPEGPYYPGYDDGYLPFGDPSIEIIPGPMAGWLDKVPGYDPDGLPGDGWWNLSGELFLRLENQKLQNPHKEIWLQLTWQEQSPGNRPFLQVQDDQGVWSPETTIPLVEEVVLEGDGVTTLLAGFFIRKY